MRLSASDPVTWPDRPAVDRWWREALADLDRTYVDAAGRVHDPEVPDDVPVRLVAGSHLAPGATYEVEGIGDAARLRLEVAGVPGRRTARAVLSGRRGLLGGSGTLAQAEVDGLDAFGQVTGRSEHPYLRGDLRMTPDPAAPFDLDVRLRWLRVTARAVVTADGRLQVDLDVRSRGAWTPATAPVIALIGRFAGPELERSVAGWAESLTAVAEGREPPARMRARELEQGVRDARTATALLRDRLTRTEDQMSGLGWWAGRSAAWLRAYDALPPTPWPSDETSRSDGTFTPGAPGAASGGWAGRARSRAAVVAHAPRDQRRAAIEREVATFDHRASLDAGVDPGPSGAAPAPVLTEEMLALRWLRSPWSTWTYLKRMGAAPGPGELEAPEGPAAGGTDRSGGTT